MGARDDVRIEVFDVRSAGDRVLADYVAYLEARRAEARPEDPPASSETAIASLRNIPRHIEAFGWMARGADDDTVVAEIHGFRHDTPENRHVLHVDLGVLEAHRRRGLGTELLRRVVEKALPLGMTVAIGVTNDREPAGATFCEHLGAAKALEVHTNRLLLDEVDRGLVHRWIEEGPLRAPAYGLVGFDGACPDDLVEEVVDLFGVMNDAPRGDLAVRDQRMTVSEFRDQERMVLAGDKRWWWLLARHEPTGVLVGLTHVSWDPRSPKTVSQGDTGVRPEHRGRGLGKWLKASMLDRILAELTDAEDIKTGNADSNAAMLAINEQLGFRPYLAMVNWQIPLEDLSRALASE